MKMTRKLNQIYFNFVWKMWKTISVTKGKVKKAPSPPKYYMRRHSDRRSKTEERLDGRVSERLGSWLGLRNRVMGEGRGYGLGVRVRVRLGLRVGLGWG